jgi:hypothetical protein
MRRHEQKLPKKTPSNKADRREKKLMRRIQTMKALIRAASTAGNMRRMTIVPIVCTTLRHLTAKARRSFAKEQVALLPY